MVTMNRLSYSLSGLSGNFSLLRTETIAGTELLWPETKIVWDHLNGDGSFIVALDKRDGKELWRVKREEIDTWATPLVLEVNGRAQAIVPAMERIRSYDLATGAVVWEGEGLTMNAIPSPVHEDGLVVLMSGFRGNDLRVVRVADAKGNIDVDDLQKEVFAWVHQEIPQHVEATQGAIDILSIARAFERIADMATNIAEDVIFVTEGSVVRHSKL